MARYLARRIAFAFFLVFAVSSASLVLARLAPGDFASQELDRASVERLRNELGLNKSIAAQYRDWIAGAVHFDFGRSLKYNRPVRELIPERAANTAILSIAALFVATCVGIPLGVVAGSRKDGAASLAIRAASLLFVSMPPLLTALFLVFMAARTGWFPIGGIRSTVSADAGSLVDLLHHLVIPAAALGLPLAAMLERLQAQATSEAVSKPFVTATLARGVPRTRVIWRDAFKASLLPVASVYGLVIGTLLSGSFAVEVITSWPGLGSLMLDALINRDVFLVTGCAGTGAMFLAFGTLISDVALAVVDPRTREASQS